jgi:UDP-glucose 4-epimerase
MKKIMITGGAGYIGSHCALSLINNGFEPFIVDNFSNSRLKQIKNIEKIIKDKISYYNLDLRNTQKLRHIFEKHNFYGVIHCAGFKAVNESTKIPLTYFNNNITSTISLLECMQEKKVFRLIFSSSATVYNSDQALPFKEEKSDIGKTTTPYGTSKYIIERILGDVAQSDSRWSIGITRYFNPIGNHYSGLIADNPKGIPNNLIPYIVKVAEKKLPYLKIFGNNYSTRDGTCIRDYIHVMDIAYGHVAIFRNKKLKKGLKIYNFGTGKGSTVLEVVKTFEQQTGISIPIKFIKRRKGDVPISFCSADKALKQLSWRAINDLKKAMIDIKATLNLKL